MLFEIRFSGDSNLKDSKFYFVQPYLCYCITFDPMTPNTTLFELFIKILHLLRRFAFVMQFKNKNRSRRVKQQLKLELMKRNVLCQSFSFSY